MKIKKLNKKAQPQVVATVLLILIVIIAIVIIMGFVMPFVRDRISESSCLDIVGELTISNDPAYTCYDSAGNEIIVQIKRGNVEIEGFIIEIGSATTQSYTITEDYHDTEVEMYDDTTVRIPAKISALTYNITGYTSKPDSVIIYPILEGGKTCDPTDTRSDIDACFNPF